MEEAASTISAIALHGKMEIQQHSAHATVRTQHRAHATVQPNAVLMPQCAHSTVLTPQCTAQCSVYLAQHSHQASTCASHNVHLTMCIFAATTACPILRQFMLLDLYSSTLRPALDSLLCYSQLYHDTTGCTVNCVAK